MLALEYPTDPRRETMPATKPAIGAAEERLLERCAKGDVEAFSVLVDRYRDPVYSLAYRMIQDADDASDAAQDTFVRAWRALPRFDRSRAFLPWLFTIAANVCRTHRSRPRLRLVKLDEVSESDGALTDRSHDPGRRSEGDLHEAVRSLPTKYRIVLILRHLRDLSYAEIAEVLHLPVSTVEHRLRTARELLQQALTEAA